MQFLPSPDFLERGRFKLQKSIREAQLTQTECLTYKENYDKVIQESKSNLTNLSIEAIAALAEVSVDLTKRILNDVFQELADMTRRSNREARLFIKNLGYLLVFKNRELAFQHTLQDTITAE